MIVNTVRYRLDDSHKYSRGIDLMMSFTALGIEEDSHKYSRGIDLMIVINTAEVSIDDRHLLVSTMTIIKSIAFMNTAEVPRLDDSHKYKSEY